MSNHMEGFVLKIASRDGNSKRGKWVLDNLLLQDADGEELGWFGLGFRKDIKVPPKCKEGDYIVFEYEEDGKYRNVVEGSAKIRAADKAPTPPPAPQSGSASAAGGSTQQSIHYQNSRTAAIKLVDLLLNNDALSITGAKGAAGKAARFEEITEAVDQQTVKFFNDLESFRLFETVQDIGIVDTGADGDLPDSDPAPSINDGDDDEPL